ncbi:MAG: rhodanese-like domain-containing protein [Anaerolineae bacterium]
MKRILILTVFALIASLVIIGCTPATVARINPDEYVSQFSDSDTEHILIDVRTRGEFASGHIAGALNIPVEEIASRLNEIPAGMPVVIYCRSGNRSATASATLSRNDFSEIYDLGGIIGWSNAGYPITQ